jgi:hypothetical protein
MREKEERQRESEDERRMSAVRLSIMDALPRYCFGAILRLAFLLAATTIRAPQLVMIPPLSPLS